METLKKRCIMIFPQFENINVINRIRDKYDPLSTHVSPHITLVFPFESSLSLVDIRDYLKRSLRDFKCFNLSLGNLLKVDDSTGIYLFLEINEGNSQIKKLNKLLNKGLLNEYKPSWVNDDNFIPHMTIGSFKTTEELDKAYNDIYPLTEEFKTLVKKISVEIIDENEDSIIEMELDLCPLCDYNCAY